MLYEVFTRTANLLRQKRHYDAPRAKTLYTFTPPHTGLDIFCRSAVRCLRRKALPCLPSFPAENSRGIFSIQKYLSHAKARCAVYEFCRKAKPCLPTFCLLAMLAFLSLCDKNHKNSRAFSGLFRSNHKNSYFCGKKNNGNTRTAHGANRVWGGEPAVVNGAYTLDIQEKEHGLYKTSGCGAEQCCRKLCGGMPREEHKFLESVVQTVRAHIVGSGAA